MAIQNFSVNRFHFLLSGLVLLELVAQTYGFFWGYEAAASVLYLAAGLGVAVLPLWKREPIAVSGNKWFSRAAWVLLLLLTAWCVWRTALLLPATPLDYRQADMLPVIRTMAERWWNGVAIYTPIEKIWGGMQPIYLPAMWLPFTVGVRLDIDIRWISAVLLLASLLLIFFGAVHKGRFRRSYLLLFGILPVFLLCFYIFGLHPTLLTLSEEPVVVFYYVLLACGLFQQRPLLTGLAIALCLLSRYSLVFWVPMYLIYLFYDQSRKAAFLTLGAMIISLILLLTAGRAWEQLPFFLHLQDSYLQELLKGESNWGHLAQMEHNPGLIKFLPYAHIATWHRLLIYGSLLMPVLSLLLYKRYRLFLDERFFGLCSLKLTMVYFYNMLTIPYSYLFYPSTFLSLFILFATFPDQKNRG